MKKTVKKAKIGTTTSQTTKKPTPVYRDEMGNPRTKAQQKQWEKDELEMIDYKGRPADSYPGGKGKASPTKTDSTKTVSKSAAPKKKMKSGGALKAVPSDKQKSLGKLPTEVRNKMGYQKTGGKTKKKMMGGGKCKYGCK